MDHTIVHFEIPAEDVGKLRKFYTELFGWKIEKSSGSVPYWLIETVPVDEQMEPLRPGVNGGMFKKDRPELKPVNYISVESMDEYIKKIFVNYKNQDLNKLIGKNINNLNEISQDLESLQKYLIENYERSKI